MPRVSQTTPEKLVTARANKLFRRFRKLARKRLTFKSRINNMIYPYKQWCDSSELSHATIESDLLDKFFAWQFTLDMIPQYSTFVSLYDQYRITSIELIIRATSIVNTPSGSAQGAPIPNHLFIYAVDHDDSTLPTSYNQIREYGNAREVNMVLGHDCKIRFKPYVSTLVYNGVTPAYCPKPAPFLDLSHTDIPHYGVKMAVKGGANDVLYCTVSARYCIEFKNAR